MYEKAATAIENLSEDFYQDGMEKWNDIDFLKRYITFLEERIKPGLSRLQIDFFEDQSETNTDTNN